jgi:hypothetical protein
MIENVLQLQSDFIFNHDVTNGVSRPVIMIWTSQMALVNILWPQLTVENHEPHTGIVDRTNCWIIFLDGSPPVVRLVGFVVSIAKLLHRVPSRLKCDDSSTVPGFSGIGVIHKAMALVDLRGSIYMSIYLFIYLSTNGLEIYQSFLGKHDWLYELTPL